MIRHWVIIKEFDDLLQDRLANINNRLAEKYENYQINDRHLSYNEFLRRLSENMEEKKKKHDIDDSETMDELCKRLKKVHEIVEEKLKDNPNYLLEKRKALFGIDICDKNYPTFDDKEKKELCDKIDEFFSTRINKQ